MKRGGGRPTNGYYQADGTRVPSVTTITGHMKSAALIKWAYNRGRDGVELYGSRDEAAETGSIVHQWIENDLYGEPLQRYDEADSRRLAEATQGYEAYRDWRGTVELDILETEVPLVSETFGFGGTLDALAILNGERCIFDWKTSNSTYPDYIAQVAAYRQLVNEAYDTLGNGGPVERAFLLRVGKTYGDFHFHAWPSRVLDMGWEWFTAAKAIYELEKRLKAVAS